MREYGLNQFYHEMYTRIEDDMYKYLLVWKLLFQKRNDIILYLMQ